MHYQTILGDKDSAWLLLVHGLLASRKNWFPNVAGLSRRFNLVLVDLPAHGDSPAPADPAAWHPDAMVDRLDEIRAELGLARWFVCGQSFGAGLTIRYAMSRPDRVPAQVFTNARTVFRDEGDPAEQEARAQRAARIKAGGMAALREERFHPRFARRFPQPLRDLLVADADRIDIDGYARILTTTLPQATLRTAVARCTVPTLLVNGRHERLFQPVRAQLGLLWPGLEIADIDGGHAVNIENPAGFDAAVIGFLSRHAAALSSPQNPDLKSGCIDPTAVETPVGSDDSPHH